MMVSESRFLDACETGAVAVLAERVGLVGVEDVESEAAQYPSGEHRLAIVTLAGDFSGASKQPYLACRTDAAFGVPY